ncbi:Lrp/AsnC family transcriptional regulator [Glutamicibacter endophyticus]|uniref:Lrp/AsnC family transcriptional regulator n=1 Tax=Glutamicibacter endophyticus TaxID=1522174 RepID=UPI003AF0FCD2
MPREPELNDLQRNIIAALQVDGRATWRKIATVLGEPERTVARYGSSLLADRKVIVAALQHHSSAMIVAFKCAPGTAQLACEALAQRADTSYSYMVTGQNDVVAELRYDGDITETLTLQLPATPGVRQYVAYPVLKFFKTIRGWTAGNLTEAQRQALAPELTGDPRTLHDFDELSSTDEQIIAALAQDGRASIESIARQVKLGESTVSRRLEWLLRSEYLSIRALVEPALLERPVEALLWVQTSPRHLEELGQRLATLPEVRYAAAVAGDCQLIVDVTVRSQADLYRFISHATWGDQLAQVKTSMVVQARKRGGRKLA